jgi:hypothetical protein
MGQFIIVSPDGHLKKEERAERPNLDELQAAVGGLITTVDFFLRDEGMTNIEAYANDEGILMDLPPNPVGTTMCLWNHMLYGPIVMLIDFPEED